MRQTIRIFGYAIASVILIALGHATNSQPLLLGGLAVMLIIAILNYKKYLIPLMLFYLPFAPVLKLHADGFSFFTIALLVIIVIFSANSKFRFDSRTLLIFSALLGTASFAKLMLGLGFSLDFFVFFAMLLFIPNYLQKFHTIISFKTTAIFFALGVTAAAVLSQQLMALPSMQAYINVYEWERMDLTRLSGFYGDANYYSAQILAAISGLLIIITARVNRLAVPLMGLVLLLIYFGSLSVSKSFLIFLAIVLPLWLTAYLSTSGRLRSKFLILIAIFLLVGSIVVGAVFQEQIAMYQTRFNLSVDSDSLTTGRLEIFNGYNQYFKNNAEVLMFGQGYSQVYYAAFDNRASHNIIIQLIYQFGILGLILIGAWMIRMKRIVVGKRKALTLNGKALVLMITAACLLPWIALDMLFLDDFYFIITFYLIAMHYIFEKFSLNKSHSRDSMS